MTEYKYERKTMFDLWLKNIEKKPEPDLSLTNLVKKILNDLDLAPTLDNIRFVLKLIVTPYTEEKITAETDSP